ncbi:MAG TPA: hypothetical protein VH639_12160 [Bryobacteraceae bacterium]|jgi:hypothetical protein
MPRHGVLAIGCTLAAWPVLAQEAPLTREGNTWKHTASSSVNVEPGGRLQIIARGRIVVRGGAGGEVKYTLVQTVRAESEADARRLIGYGQLSARSLGRVTRIDVQQSSSVNVGNQLTVMAPRGLSDVVVQSEFGQAIEASDFDGRVTAVISSGDIHLDRVRGYVVARTGGGNLFFGQVGGIEQCFTGGGSVTVENAAGAVNDCRTGGGEVLVKQAGGPVTLENDGGNITVERAASTVEAHAVSGLIRVGQAGGEVIADSRGGSIQVGSAKGVKAESAQGAVRLRGPSGPMNVSTALGSILAELMPGAPIKDSWLDAGSGDVTVLIPSNFPVSIMVTNERGGYPMLMSDFPEVRTEGLPLPRPPVVAQGAINGGGPVLHINAGRGVVYLRRSR